jgi:indole-3-glycerol phosphate synthase
VISISSDNPFTPEIELDLEMTRRMRDMIPSHIRVMISENLKTMRDVDTLSKLDVDAIMVSEPLIEAAGDAESLARHFVQPGLPSHD